MNVLTPLLAVGAIAVAALGAHLWMAQGFRRKGAALVATLSKASPVSRGHAPSPLLDAALRNGAEWDGGWRTLRIVQDAQFRVGPDKPWVPMPAVQHISLGAPGFVWIARQPGLIVPRFAVIDAFVAGQGHLYAALFGSVPVASMAGPVTDRAEAMRYLAELAWAPDAIAGNPALVWRKISDVEVEVSLAVAADRVAVRLHLDGHGNILEMQADRPDTAPDGTTFTRPWRGSFTDYGQIGGRAIPRAGEVGYVYPDGYHAYWRGRILDYDLMT
jgi:hypothetical protein